MSGNAAIGNRLPRIDGARVSVSTPEPRVTLPRRESPQPRASALIARLFGHRAPPWQRVPSALLSLAIVIVAAIPIARFVGVALQRLNYPFELEWIESGTVSHIQVVLSGHQLYREPSLDFTPFIYAPLYYYVAALPSLIFGVGLLAPRLVSLLSTLGCFVLLGRWVRDETGDPVAGVAAAGLFSALFQVTGLWLDLARIDAFFLFLTLAANVLARTAHTTRRAALVGVLLAAACFTKQLGFPLALPVLVFLALRSLRLGVVAGLVAGAVIGFFGLVFQLTSSGWFYYYLFKLPARHPVEWTRLVPDARTYFLGDTLPLTLAGIALLCGWGFSRAAPKRWLYTALFVALAVTTSFLPFLKSGGFQNGLIPAFAALCLAAGIQLGALRRRGYETALGPLGANLFAGLLLAYQCQTLTYDPHVALPTPEDRAANETVLERIKRLPHPIWVMGSSHWTRLAEPNGVPLHAAALSDVFKGSGPEATLLRARMTADLKAHRFATIVADRAFSFLPPDIVELIQNEYRPQGSLMSGIGAGVAWPKTGAAIRPDGVWIARKRPHEK